MHPSFSPAKAGLIQVQSVEVPVAQYGEMNSGFIRQKIQASERLRQLNEIAVNQVTSLLKSKKLQKLSDSNPS